MTEMDFDPLPGRLQAALDNEVQPGERVVWVGRPGPRVGDWRDWLAIVFGIEWTALALLFTAGAVLLVVKGGMRHDHPLWSPACFPLFGVPFVLFGVWMITGPIRARRRLRNTVYIVTDRRAVVIECRYWGMASHSFGPEELAGLSFVDRQYGRGDVILSETAHVDSDGNRRVSQVGFLNIPDSRRIEGLVKALAATADRKPDQ